LSDISSYLNDYKIQTPKGGPWDSCKISRILRNPVYVKADADIYIYYKNKGCILSNDINDFVNEFACFLYGKRDTNERKYTNVKDHVLSLALHRGIVDSEVFLKCQQKLDDNKQIKNSGKGKYSWLSGLTKCGYCKYTMTVVRAEGNCGEYKYFICRGKTNYKCCSGHNEVQYVDSLEKIVQDEIFEKIKSMNNTTIELEGRSEEIDTNKLKIRIFEIDTQINNLLNNLAQSSVIVTDYINKRIQQYDAEKKELTIKLRAINKNTQLQKQQDSIFKCVDNWQKNTLEQKKAVAKYLIEKILIKDDEVAINWKI
jgi:hypothetical protein